MQRKLYAGAIPLLFFSSLLFAQPVISQSCLIDTNYDRALLVDVNIISEGEKNSQIGYIGGYFHYEISFTNLGKPLTTNIVSELHSPEKENTIVAENSPLVDLNHLDTKQFIPKPEDAGDDYKIYYYGSLGTYRIVLKEPNTHFFRCFNGKYTHNFRETEFSFDVMPSWQVDAINIQKEQITKLEEIQESQNKENSANPLVENFFWPFIVLVLWALIGKIFVNFNIPNTINWLVFLITIIITFILALFVWYGWTNESIYSQYQLPVNMMSILLVAYAYLSVDSFILARSISDAKKKFPQNYKCLACNKNFYLPKNNEKRCSFCQAYEITDLAPLREANAWNPINRKIQKFVEKLKKK